MLSQLTYCTLFVGIFRDSQMPYIKISSFPVLLVVNDCSHWIAIFIDHNSLEIFDTRQEIFKSCFKATKCFISNYCSTHNIALGPIIQHKDSMVCGLYVVYYCQQKCLGFSFSQILNKFNKKLYQNDTFIVNYFS